MGLSVLLFFLFRRLVFFERFCLLGFLVLFEKDSSGLFVYLIIGYDVLWRAVRNIFNGQIFDENFLMCVATVGAFALAVYRGINGQETEGFDEACAVLIFYQVGEWFQSYATGKSRKSISELMDIRPDYTNLLLWIVFCAAAASVLGATFCVKRKQVNR